MTAKHIERPDNVTLLPGAMQHWSDLDRETVGASPAVRTVIDTVVSGARTVAVVGPAPLDLLVGLADQVAELTVVTRSIPDAATIGNLLLSSPGARVVCGSAAGVVETFDAVIVLADLCDVLSLEAEPETWEHAYATVRALVAPDGRLLLGVENELGLQRMTALRSRYSTDTDADWSVTSTFDRSRPRSVESLRQAAAGESNPTVLAAFPDWTQPTVLATTSDRLPDALRTVLEASVLASPSFRRLGADPTRLTRAAVLSGRMTDFASGWFVVTGASSLPDGPAVIESTSDGKAVTYTPEDADAVRRVDERGEARTVHIAPTARLLSEELLDRAAGADLRSLRDSVRAYADGIRAMADDGVLPSGVADVRPDNVLVSDDGYTVIAPKAAGAPVDDALGAALVDLVEAIRARGARHPWPVAIDDATMAGNLAAMAGIDPAPVMVRASSRSEQEPALPAYDIPGLLAVVERLTESNTALASKAAWYEQKLSVRERELRSRAAQHRQQLANASRQQEILRGRAEDIRRSLTYRAGNVLLGPVRELRAKTRERRD